MRLRVVVPFVLTSLLAQRAPAESILNVPGMDEKTLVFGAESSLVVLDVVVRDKKGRLVKDLAASEIEVFEDGQRQPVSDFRAVAFGPQGLTRALTAATDAAPGPRGAEGAVDRAAAIAFVFDRLSAEARGSAHEAARAYTAHGHVDGDLMAVFSIDGTLRTLQGFTTDLAVIETAFRRASGQPAAADERASGAPDGATAILNDATLRAVEARVDYSLDRITRNRQGLVSANALLAVVDGLKTLPGRKTLVFFSQGLNLPESVLPQFRAVIASANRANVAIYAIDAGGLRTLSDTRQARRDLEATATRRRTEAWVGYIDAPGSLNEEVESAEEMLRSNPQSGLGRLAEETGGFLVASTNDAGDAFARIQEEMRFHYLLSYAPTNQDQDGRFRAVQIRSRRGGLRIHARAGYFAVPPGSAAPLSENEARAVAQLDRRPRPDAFPLRAAALSFPAPGREGRVSVLAELSGDALVYDKDERHNVYVADFTVVARLRDEAGREVERLTRQYPLSVPLDAIDAARRGNVLFFEEADLAPGRYSLEAVVFDALGERASVRTSSVEVPRGRGNVRLSSLVLVGRVEQLDAEERDRDNPLYVGESIVYPNLGLPYHKSLVPTLGFYFTACGREPGLIPRKATVDLLRGASVLVTLPTTLPEASRDGRLQHVAALPLEQLPAGEYTLRVTVSEGAVAHTREARFTVAE